MSTVLAWLWLVLGAIFAIVAVTGFVPFPGGRRLRYVWDGVAIVGNELAPQTLVVAIVVASILAASGATEHAAGRVGGAATLLAVILLLVSQFRARSDGTVLERALATSMPAGFRSEIVPQRAAMLRTKVPFTEWLRPLRFDTDGIETIGDLEYGPHGALNTLDVMRGAGSGASPQPVLLHIHGGGLMFGRKNFEALPLLHHLARRGWIIVTINYRLSPAAKWPAHIEDAKRALAWIREHIAEWGGDPGFVAVTGGSAGGLLSGLLALTANEPRWQPGFEAIDTSVQAAVPLYTGYDVRDKTLVHLASQVMSRAEADDPVLWADASPVEHVRPDAPPFFIVNGTLDALVPIEEARSFVKRLAPVSQSPVVYAELQASHGFDAQHSLRAEHAVDAVHCFLEWAYSQWLRRSHAEGADPGLLPQDILHESRDHHA